MFTKPCIRSAVILLSVIFLSVGPQPVLAQEKTPPPPQYDPGVVNRPSTNTFHLPQSPLSSQPGNVANPTTLPLGQSGFTLRPVDSYGVVTEGYLEDTQHLNYPYAVATDGDTVWIADTNGNRAVHYQKDGAYLGQIGKAGFRNYYADTDLETVYDVATDGSGNVYLVDMFSSHVAIFNSAGAFIRNIGQSWNNGSTNDLLNNPFGVVVDSNGFIYVADSGNCRVQVFKPDGTYQTTLGETGVCASDNTHFSTALRHMDIFNNQLFVADAANHRVQIFDISSPNTSIPYISSLGVSGLSDNDNSHFNWPTGVAVNSGLIYVADMNNQRIQVFDQSTMAYQATLTGPSASDTFSYPSDVETDASGNLYVADNGHARVIQFDASLVHERDYGIKDVPYITDLKHYNRPSGLAFGSTGNLYITEDWGNRLVILDKNGNPIKAIGEPGVYGSDNAHFSGPQGVAVSPGGEVYVADTGNNRIQIFTAAGLYSRTKGEFGTGNVQFNQPSAVAFGLDGSIFIADSSNSRVQVYDAAFNFKRSITGFQYPRDLAVDTQGNLYVLDRGGQSVLIYNKSLQYLRSITGTDGNSWMDFAAFGNPTSIAVDAAGRVYITCAWGSRLLVFDSNGAFLTAYTISGDQMGENRQIEGMAFDSHGQLFTASSLNHRIQIFAQGIPGWRQASLNGFGDTRIHQILSLAVHNGQLFAGADYFDDSNNGHSDLYYSANGKNWTGIGFDFGAGAATLLSYKGYLYLGTWDNKLWRSADGKTSWTQINTDWTGTTGNTGFGTLVTFNDTIYATLWNETTGTQIWRSNSGDTGTWNMVIAGFGSPHANGAISSAVFNGQLYLGVGNWIDSSPFIERTTNGTSWEKVGETTFRATAANVVSALAVFNNKLYAYTIGNGASKVWISSDGSNWQANSAFTLPDQSTNDFGSLEVYQNDLYLIAGNPDKGLEVWRTEDGSNWVQVINHGLNGPEHQNTWFDSATVVFNSNLYFADSNYSNGAAIWSMTHSIFLPLTIR
jgi:sugar lactone lactonase YvrE